MVRITFEITEIEEKALKAEMDDIGLFAAAFVHFKAGKMMEQVCEEALGPSEDSTLTAEDKQEIASDLASRGEIAATSRGLSRVAQNMIVGKAKIKPYLERLVERRIG